MATTMAEKEIKYENYGSVDLNDGNGLPRDWQRDSQDPTLISLAIVGHVNGKCDAFLKEAPNARHQFSWCAPYDREKIALLRMQGYSIVTSDKWEKNPLLWDWQRDEKDRDEDGPEYCVRFEDRLWARPEARYLAEKARRAARPNAANTVNADLAKHPGAVTARDQDGVALRPMTRTQ